MDDRKRHITFTTEMLDLMDKLDGAEVRILGTLIRLSEMTRFGECIKIAKTQMEIAMHVDKSQTLIYRRLKALKDAGVIIQTRNAVMLLNPDFVTYRYDDEHVQAARRHWASEIELRKEYQIRMTRGRPGYKPVHSAAEQKAGVEIALRSFHGGSECEAEFDPMTGAVGDIVESQKEASDVG